QPVVSVNANAATISTVITGNQGFVKSGSGTLFLAGTNTYLGTTRLNAGILHITNDTNLGSANAGLVFNGGTLRTTSDVTINRGITFLANAVISNELATTLAMTNAITGGFNLTKTGAGTLVLSGSNTYSGTTMLLGGEMSLVNNGYMTGTLRVWSNATFSIKNNAYATFSSLFLGENTGSTGNLNHVNGTITVSGHIRVGHYPNETSTYIMNGGTLRITSTTGTNPFGTGEQGSGVMYLGIDGTGIFIQNGGDVIIPALVLDNRYNQGPTAGTDTYTLNGGTLTLGSWGIQGQAGTLVNFGGGTVKASTNWTGSTAMALQTGAGGNTIFDTTGGNITLSGTISGTGGLTKISTGTLTLSGYNTYSGTMIISNGTLAITGVDGSAGGSTNIIVEKDALLSIDTLSGNAIGDTARLVINSDATTTGRVYLASHIRKTVGSIYFGATPAGAGTWGSSASTADNKNDDYFTGTGILRIGTYGADGSWSNDINGAWSVAGNWTNSIIPFGDSKTAYFTNAITADRMVTQDSNSVIIGSMTFNAPGSMFNWTLTGNPIELANYSQPVISVLTNTATISTVITGIQGFVKSGPGTLILAGTNTYTGSTRINAGILYVTNDDALGQAGAGITFNGGTLSTTNDITFNNRTVTLLSGGAVFTNEPGSTLTIPNTVVVSPSPAVGGSTLTKNGEGTLIFNGNSTMGAVTQRLGTLTLNGAYNTLGAITTYGGTFTIGGGTNTVGSITHRLGTLNFNGASNNSTAITTYGGATGTLLNINGVTSLGTNNSMLIGNANGDRSVVTIATNALMYKMYVGNASGAAGATYQTGGTVNVGLTIVSQDVLSIGVNNGYGYYLISDGILNAGQLSASAGSGTGNIGVFDICGGTVNVVKNSGGWLISGGWGASSKGVINIFGGTLAGPAATPVTLSIFANKAHGMFNLLGASAVLIATNNANGLNMMGAVNNSNSVFNLNAGTLIASRIYQGSASPAQFNFNGGTLLAWEGGMTVTMSMNTGGVAYVYNGGAIINSTNSTIVISTPLLAPTGYGVTNIAIASGGTGYIGAPYLLVSGGSGKGATAIAQIDISQASPTFGQVTNIIVTCPGSDYQPGDVITVTLAGGGCTIPATIGDITLTPNIGGGLTKTGSGTLRLSAGNSYSGTTLVNTGLLYASTVGALGGTTNITIEAGGQVIIDTTSTTINSSASINLQVVGSTYGTIYLTNGVNEIVSALYSNGVALATGTWGRTASGCTYTNDNFFTGPGLLTVRTGYGQWIPDADGNWNTDANWTNNIVPLGSMATAYFTNSISGHRSINQDIATLNIANLYFGSPLTTWNWSLTNNIINFTNTIATPVVTVTTNTATISSSLTSVQGFTKNGSGTLNLNGNTNSLGSLSVGTGSLNLYGIQNSISNVNISGTTTFNGETNIIGTLTVSRDTMTLNGMTNYVTNVTVYAGTLTFSGKTNAIGQVSVNNGQMLLANGTNLVGFTTVNGGTLTLADSSTNAFTSNLYMTGGGTNAARMNIYGPMTMNNNFNLQIGNAAGSRAIATITTNSTIWRTQIGYNNNTAAGALFQSDGLVRISSTSNSDDDFVLGRSFIGAYGYYNMSGGILSNAFMFQVGLGGCGVMDMSGGLVTTPTNYLNIGRNYLGSGTNYGIVNISGGTMYGSSVRGIYMGWDASTATRMSVAIVNISGTGTLWGGPEGNTTRYIEMMINPQVLPNVNQSIINLNGGTLVVNQIRTTYSTGLALLGFNGGLLMANPGTTLGASFLQNLTAAYIYQGGAFIDSGTNIITIAQPLLAPSGYGVSSIAFTSGSGYIGAPVVSISGGSGIGATAIAQMDFTAGQITNILVTSDGSGYQAGDTLTATLIGGGCIIPGTAGPVTLASNSCGGLIKIGTGTLRLTGTSTYTGTTIVSNGILSAAGPSAIASSTSIVVCAGGQLDIENKSDLINNTAVVDIRNGGIINLTNGLTEIVGSIYSNGTLLASGIWGASGSGASNTNDALFTGSGMIATITEGDGSWANPLSGKWTETANWTNGIIPYGATRTAFFTNSISADCTVNQNVSLLPLGNLLFGSPNSYNWTLRNSPIFFTNATTPVITVNNNTTILKTVISGQQGFIKAGAGTLQIGAMNEYTGSTIISNGKLQLGMIGGLMEGRLPGSGLNTTWPNPATNYVKTTRMANTNVKSASAWGDYETWVYTGYINNIETNDVTWTFGKSIDDQVSLKIDGYQMLTAGGWNQPGITNYTLTPGYHSFDLRLYNGAGGAGCVNTLWWNVSNFGFGYDPNGRNVTNVMFFQVMTDSGNGDLFAVPYGGLPTNTALQIAENGVFDLNGVPQSIGSLSDYSGAGGFVTNSISTMATLTVGYEDTSTAFSGIITGSNALTKVGNGRLTLSGQNQYTGDTRINRGILELTTSGTIKNSQNIMIDGGGQLVIRNTSGALKGAANVWIRSGKLDLTNGVNYFVTQLVLGEETKNVGTWGSSTSSAANKDDTYFSGNGILTVTLGNEQQNSGSWAVDSGGNWLNVYNWMNLAIAQGIGQTAYFTNAITGNVTVTNTHTALFLETLTFNSPFPSAQNWTITGNAITLTNATTTPAITVSADTTYLAVLIESPQGIVKPGNGTLQIGTGSTAGWIPSDIAVSAGSLGFSRSDNVIFSNRITVTSGTGYKDAAGTLTLTSPGTNVLAVGGNDAYTIRNGKLVFAGGPDSVSRITGELVIGNSVGTSTTLEISNGTHTVSGYITLGKATGSGTATDMATLYDGTLNVGGISLLSAGATNLTARFSVVDGTLNLGDSGYSGYGCMTTNGAATSTRQVLLSGGTIGVLNNYVGLPVPMILTNSPGTGTVLFRTSGTNNAARQMTVFGGLSGAGTVVKTGGGTLYLNGTNINYRGSMAASNGTLALSSVGFTGTVSIASGATLMLPGGLRGEYFSLSGVSPVSISNNLATMNSHFAPLKVSLISHTGSTGSNLNFGATGTNFPVPYNAGGTAVQNLEARWTGKFLAETTGTYTFGVSSDDGCTLFVDGTNVFWKGGGGYTYPPVQTSGTITLDAGLHDIVIGYYQGTGSYGLTLFCAKPGGPTNILDNNLLSYGYGTTIGSISAEPGSTLNISSDTLIINQTTDQTLGCTLIGSGGTIVKQGAATLTFAGASTYTGSIIISNGIIAVTTSGEVGGSSLTLEANTRFVVENSSGNVVGDDAAVRLNGAGSTGKIYLTNGVADVVGSLFFDGTPQALGTYGATGSGATTIDDTHFEGTGILIVGGTQTGSWDEDSDGGWNTAGNWTGDIIPFGSGFAYFTNSIAASRVVDQNYANLMIAGMTFGSPQAYNWTVTNSSFRLIGSGAINVTTNTATIASAITGNSGLLKMGTGTLVLSGTNDFTGSLVITNGTLRLGSNNTLPATQGNTVLASTLDLNGFSNTVRNLSGNGTATCSVAGNSIMVISNNTSTTFAGSIENGAGSVSVIKKGSGILTISGETKSYTGVTDIAEGTVTLEALLSSPVNIGSAGTLTIPLGSSGLRGEYYNITVSNPGTTNYYVSVAALNTHLSSYTPALISSSLNAGPEFNFGNTGSGFPVPYNSGGANMEVRWTGQFNAPVDGEYTFYTASDDGSVLFIDGILVVNNNFFQGVVERSGTATLSAGLHDIVIAFYQGGGGYGMYANVTIPGGSKQLIPNSMLSVGNMSIGSLSGEAGSSLIMGNVHLSVSQATDQTFAGIISGNGTITKSGTATLTLSGNSIDGGSIIVNAGTLFVSGSTSPSNTIAVTNGATLAGTGTIHGNAIIAAGTELSPAGSNTAGTLTIGNLSLSDGAYIAWDYSTNDTFDVITITNLLNVTTSSVVNLKMYNKNSLPEPSTQQFIIMTWPAATPDPDASVVWNIVKPAGAGTEGWASPQVTVDSVNNHLTLTFPQTGFPAVDNGQGATSITTNSAVLNGNYTATGSTAVAHIYWGTFDGGTNKSNWENVYVHGITGPGAFSTPISNLIYGHLYRYRCYASNAVGECWTSLSSNFSVQAQTKTINGIRASIFDNLGGGSAPLLLAGSTYNISYTRVFTGGTSANILGKAETPQYNVILSGQVYSGTDLAGYTQMFPGYITREQFSASFSGLLIPRTTGSHDFRWNCDDYAIMYIDVNNDGVFQSGEGSTTGTAPWYGTNTQTLVAGQPYNYIFMAKDDGGGESVNLWVTEPGQPEARVDPSIQVGMWKCYAGNTLQTIPATVITTTSAVLNAVLMAPGEVYDVYACWGTNNAGTNLSGWANSTLVGSWTNVTSTNISLSLPSLSPDTTYSYTFVAVNAITAIWADMVRNFKTMVTPSSYSRKMLITFNGYNKAETLTNFPVMISLGEHLAGFNYFDCQPYGTDIRFMDESASTELNFEIEQWNTNGTSYFWVQVPQFTNNCSIWAYWNSPAANVPPPYTTNGSPWVNGYAGVWHLNSTNAYGQMIDSTARGGNGVNTSTTSENGKIANGRRFNGSAYINVGDVMPATSYTKMAWVYRTNSAAAANSILSGGSGATDHILWMNANSGTTLSSGHNGSWYQTQDPVPMPIDTWMLAAVTYDSGLQTMTLYKDGTAVSEASAVSTHANGVATYIGAYAAGSQFQGNLDEVRISSVPRSSNWIWACYMNQGNAESFSTYELTFGIKNLMVSNLTSVSATPVVTLYGTGLTTSVTLYYGTTDGGTNAAAWNSSKNLGSFATLSSTNIAAVLSGFKPDTVYYFRFHASTIENSEWTAPVFFKTLVADWQLYRKMKITFSGYDKAETLPNFPALIIFNTDIANFRYNTFKTGGTDLRFLNEARNTELNYQIEEWNSVGDSYIWVQVPQFTNNCSIWAYWGASTYVLPCTSNGATWSDGYGSVWHLRDGTSNTYDAVARHTGTPVNVVSIDGIISKALDFNGSNALINTSYAQSSVTSYTVSAWIRTTDAATNRMILNDRGGGSAMSLSLGLRNEGGKPFFGLESTDLLIGQDADDPINDDFWHYLAGVWSANYGSMIDASQFKIYVDGTEVVSTPTSTGTAYAPVSGAGGSQIAYHQVWTTNLTAMLDEVRADTAARSSNWIWACYMNQGTNRSSFVQYGEVTQLPWQGTVIRLR
ncbi:MAG: hypothetical protein A2283_03430, partial [Lentisphaerae bacterium RIFOXYA12_FULL_48_11]